MKTLLYYFLLFFLFLDNPLVYAQDEVSNSTKSTYLTDDKLDPVVVNMSGYVTGIFFQDHNWFRDTYLVAENIDVSYKDWAARIQIGKPSGDLIRKLMIERSFNVFNNDLTLQVGRFTRLHSFSGDVTDSPNFGGVALFPFAEYSPRQIYLPTFSLLDGARLIYTTRLGDGLLKAHFNYGRPPVNVSQCDFKKEVFNVCDSTINMKSSFNNYDVGLTYTRNDWSFFFYNVNGKIEVEPKGTLSQVGKQIYNLAAKESETGYKAGIRYNDNQIWVQGQLYHLDYQYRTPKGALTLREINNDGYLLLGYHYADYLDFYVQRSMQRAQRSSSNADDTVLGMTYTGENKILSIEQHKGSGNRWMDYTSKGTNWKSWVITFTQKF